MPLRTRLLAGITLLDLSLVLLWLGRFIQFDDTSGSGSDDWVLPLGLVAAMLTVGAVVAAWPDRTARRAVGFELMGIAVAAVVLGAVLDGFRLVYLAGDAEFNGLVVVLALAGLGLAVPVRFAAWAVALVLVALLGLVLGNSAGEGQCAGEGDDCPPAIFGSLLGVVVGAALVVAAAAAVELRRRRTGQRDASASADATR